MIESQYSFRSPFPLSTCRIGIKILQPMLASSKIEFNLLACLQFVFCTNSCISLLNLNFLFVGILKIQNRCSITFITFVFQHITWSVPLYLEHDQFAFDTVLVNNTIHGIYVQSSVSLRILVLLITIFILFLYDLMWFNKVQ